MVRKRDAYRRMVDRHRIRLKRPKPMTGWVMAELASLTGVRPRTIRYYVDHGVLERPEFRGTATRYQRSHLLRLLAIQRLRREGVPTLAAIKQRIDAAGEAALLEAVRAQPPSASLAAALGLPAPEANGGGEGLGAARAAATNDEAGLIGESWRRVSLLPGLELLLAEDASPAVRQVAEQIRGYCGKR